MSAGRRGGLREHGGMAQEESKLLTILSRIGIRKKKNLSY